MEIVLRLEQEKDYRVVENLTREAFWNVYKPGCDEHLVLQQLRKSEAFIKELDFVAETEGVIVGNIVYSRGQVVSDDGTELEVIGFGPVSVLPAYQGQGIGKKLIEHTLSIAQTMGFKGVVIFGNPDYYHRFGFVNAEKIGIQTGEGDNFEAFMVKELSPGSLQGVGGRFIEAAAFHVDQAELELFEQQFPPKKKEVTDTQLK